MSGIGEIDASSPHIFEFSCWSFRPSSGLHREKEREIKKRAETNMSRDRDKDRKTDGGKDHLII